MSAALVSGGITALIELLVYVIALLCGVDPLALFWTDPTLPVRRPMDHRGEDATAESTCVVLPFPSEHAEPVDHPPFVA